MPTSAEIGLGLLLNAAFWIALIGGAASAAVWALIEYGPSARPIKSRRRGAGPAQSNRAPEDGRKPAAKETPDVSTHPAGGAHGMPFDEEAKIRPDEPGRAA